MKPAKMKKLRTQGWGLSEGPANCSVGHFHEFSHVALPWDFKKIIVIINM